MASHTTGQPPSPFPAATITLSAPGFTVNLDADDAAAPILAITRAPTPHPEIVAGTVHEPFPDSTVEVSLFLAPAVPGAEEQCRALAARIGEELKGLGRAVSMHAAGNHPEGGHIRLSVPVVIPEDGIIPGASGEEDAPAGAYWVLHGRAPDWHCDIALHSD
ncbi:hypothetical protein ACFWPV_09885 [Streptomyces uncialis]|uniref:hypothetical protein n=1 Tax=Streptomyces uncialis TaxID=1048205 RepID=UPI0036659AA6